MNPYDYLAFQNESFECALSKGWWEDCMTDGKLDGAKVRAAIPEKIALIHSELSEALEDYRGRKMVTVFRASDGKPEGFATELADVCIRWWDLLGAIAASLPESCPTMDVEVSKADIDVELPGLPGHPPSEIARMHWSTSRCLQTFSVAYAGQCILEALFLGKILGYDMDEEVRVKQAFNRSRSYKHGGKLV